MVVVVVVVVAAAAVAVAAAVAAAAAAARGWGVQIQTGVRTDKKKRVLERNERMVKKEGVGTNQNERYLERPPLETLIPPLATTLMTPGCNAARVPQRWSSLHQL